MAIFSVYCPACEAAYHVPSDRVTGVDRMRCGRCGLTFEPDLSQIIDIGTIQHPIVAVTQPLVNEETRLENLHRLGQPPAYRPPDNPPKPAPPAASQADVPLSLSQPVFIRAIGLGPPPPYRPILMPPPDFERGLAPDLDPWRAMSPIRRTDLEDEFPAAHSVLRPRGPGLSIGGDPIIRQAQTSWSIIREPPPDLGPSDFSLSSQGRTETGPEPGMDDPPPIPPASAQASRFEAAGDNPSRARRRPTFINAAPWAAIPLAAGMVGGGLYVFRDDVMGMFPGTIPIYAALGLTTTARDACGVDASVAKNSRIQPCMDEKRQMPMR